MAKQYVITLSRDFASMGRSIAQNLAGRLGCEFYDRDIVVALFEDEATVKTLQRRDGHVWLLPANPDYQPIDGDHARLLGKVVAVVRRYD